MAPFESVIADPCTILSSSSLTRPPPPYPPIDTMPSSSSTSGAEPESDLLMLFFATLLIAIVVASCLRTPADDRAPAGAHQQHAGGRKKATAPVPSRPMTARAKALQKELGLSYGSPVTVTTRGVVLAREGGGFVPQALDTLRLLLEFADVFLLIEVAEAPAGDADKTQALATLKAEGVVRATTGEQQGVAKHVRPFFFWVKDGRALFSVLLLIHPPSTHTPTHRKFSSTRPPWVSRPLSGSSAPTCTSISTRRSSPTWCRTFPTSCSWTRPFPTPCPRPLG